MKRPSIAVAIAAVTGCMVALPAIGQLEIGAIEEIAGDETCADTGGILAYAESINYRVYICSDKNDPTQARHYRIRNKNQAIGINLEAVDYNPQKPGYFEFVTPNSVYVLQIPSEQNPEPTMGVQLPNGAQAQEKIQRYLSR